MCWYECEEVVCWYECEEVVGLCVSISVRHESGVRTRMYVYIVRAHVYMHVCVF